MKETGISSSITSKLNTLKWGSNANPYAGRNLNTDQKQILPLTFYVQINSLSIKCIWVLLKWARYTYVNAFILLSFLEAFEFAINTRLY